MRFAATSLLVATACSGGEGAQMVTFTTVTPPQLIMVRDDAAGVWVPLDGSGTTFTYQPTGPYRVTAACEEEPGFTTLWQIARTPADDPDVQIFCGTRPRTGTIATTMVQAGRVTTEDAIAISSTPAWDVQLQTAPGEHVLVATAATHAQIERGLIVDGTLTLPELDVEAQGIAYVAAPITIPNAEAGEELRANVHLIIGDVFASVFSGAPDGALAIPMEALEAGDQQRLRASADRGDTQRFATRLGSTATTLELPAPIGATSFSVSGNDLTASWPTDHPGTIFLDVFAGTDGFSTIFFHSLEVSDSYAGLVDGALTIELADIPSIPPQMLFDYGTAEQIRTLQIVSSTETETRGVMVSESVNEPQAVRPGKLARRR
jgi:hypothetical protein